MPSKRYLTAKEAADELDISLATLYAYVSRGLIRSEEDDEGKRTRRYLTEDVDKLKARKEDRRSPEKVAARSLSWGGEPVLESALTLIDNGRLYYRGQDATLLAQNAAFEQIAVLLWTGQMSDADTLFSDVPRQLSPRCQAVLDALETTSKLTYMERFHSVLAAASVDDLAAYNLSPASVAQTGARILWLLASAAAPNCAPAVSTIAQAVAQEWMPDDRKAAELINAALILCADHELNVSSFTARCVASAGSTPYNVVIAGLAALQGFRHGGYTEQVVAFLRTIQRPEDVRSAIGAMVKRGERIPGFGHMLYPDGDPRCAVLLDMIQTAYLDSSALALSRAVIEETWEIFKEHPTIDFALGTLMQVWNLPTGSGLALFALGRTAGWIGHAIEQYAIDRIIRPRARYVGASPE